MGLDWNPIGKPRAGHEAEFERLFKQLGDLPVNVSWEVRALRKLKGINREALDRRWRAIQISPHETLSAPRVGESQEADAWARAQYPNRKDAALSEDDFMKGLAGYYVLDLVLPCDGLPRYSNSPAGYVERFSFRAQFLRDCEDIIGAVTLEKCYVSCLATGLASLAGELRASATSFVAEHSLNAIEFQAAKFGVDDFKEHSPESKADILFSAIRWCEFWSSRGHGMEAYW